jgi:hypothetical protein
LRCWRFINVRPCGPSNDVRLRHRHVGAAADGISGASMNTAWPLRFGGESSNTYACTRLPEDGEIAGSATTETADCLVSALTDPFPGAFAWLGLGRRSKARRLGREHCGSFRAPRWCGDSYAELGVGAGILADAPRGQTVAGIPAPRRFMCQGSGDERVVGHVAEMLTGIRCIACGEASSERRSRCSAPVTDHQGATSATPKSGEHQSCQCPCCLRNGRLGGAR